jgi:hypothetical protein
MPLPPDSFSRDDLAAALPEPTPEDPASLRDDIVDELADHLRLSLDRELVNTGDEASAHRRVLDRFGDPRALARKLWWDALKGRIMRNRLWNIGLALLLLATIGSVLLMANLIRSMQAAQAELMDANRAAQEALVRQLAALERKVAPEASTANTQPFAVRVVSTVDKRPIAAECVALVEVPGRPKEPLKILRRTDATGLADFGHLPRAIMHFTVQADDGWDCKVPEFFLGPNIPAIEEMLYPDTSPDRTGAVELKLPIPPEFDGLAMDKLRIVVGLEGPREVINGREWQRGPTLKTGDNRHVLRPSRFYVLCDASGRALSANETRSGGWDQMAKHDLANNWHNDLRLPPDAALPVRLPAGEYRIKSLFAFDVAKLTSPRGEPAVGFDLRYSRTVRVEAGSVSAIAPHEGDLSGLWLGTKSLPLWPRDRAIELAIDPRDVGHVVDDGSGDLRSSILLEAPDEIRRSAEPTPAPPKFKTGDHVSVQFEVMPRDELVAIWPSGIPQQGAPFEWTGFCDLPIDSILEKPSRARVLVNRFQETWHKALVSVSARNHFRPSSRHDLYTIRGFRQDGSPMTFALFLEARLEMLPQAVVPAPVEPAAPTGEELRRTN